MTEHDLLNRLNSQEAAKLFSVLYGGDAIEEARQRYCGLIEEFLLDGPLGFPQDKFPETRTGIRVFSAPGRTELGGNHTDHNRGKVLAASIQLDAAAVVAPRKDTQVLFRSPGYRDVIVDISDLSIKEEEKGHAESLIRGIAAEFAARGTPVGGFTANANNMVASGSGLSSSAAIEVLFAKIFDNLYCGGKRSALELAQIGQKAENNYFGKPCGLMDQAACASGGAVAIDFADAQNPKLQGIAFDPEAMGFALCILDTKGSHSDLTPDYAAIPAEMKETAAFFGKQVLRELDEETLFSRLTDLRKSAGDRAVLRAMHFYNENRRVDAMLAALEKINSCPTEKKALAMETYLALVRESGDSSWELLQNIYSPKNYGEQGVSLALALTKNFFSGNAPGVSFGASQPASGQMQSGPCCGACRVHGGGFAGTMQAYIPLERLNEYRNLMEGIFGSGSFTILRIRPMGAVELF